MARQGTLAGAARALRYTPSAVSQHVAQLERELGCGLVKRSANREARQRVALGRARLAVRLACLP